MTGAEMDPDDVLAMLSDLSTVGPKMMDLWGIDFLLIVDEEVPVDTHNLQWSIPANTQRSEWEWIVGTNVEYAPYVSEGTPAHEIEGNPYLFWSGADHPVRRVQHPGTSANPFFDRTLDQTESKLEEYLTEAMEGVT